MPENATDTEVAAIPLPNTTPDAQDPLPESNWLWRRVFVFLVTAAILVMIWRWGDRLSDIAAVAVMKNQDPQVVIYAIKTMATLMGRLLAMIGLMILFYLLAPSAEQLTKLMQTAKSLREGVRFTKAASTNAQGDAAAYSTAGKPPEPEPVAPIPVSPTPTEGAGSAPVPLPDTDPWNRKAP